MRIMKCLQGKKAGVLCGFAPHTKFWRRRGKRPGKQARGSPYESACCCNAVLPSSAANGDHAAAHAPLFVQDIRSQRLAPCGAFDDAERNVRAKARVAEDRAQAVFAIGKEAGSQASVRGDPQAVAHPAEMVGQGSDQADASESAGKGVHSGRTGASRGVLYRAEIGEAGKIRQNFAGRPEPLGPPAASLTYGHEFDEAHVHGMCGGQLDKGGQFVIVDAAQSHRVDLEGNTRLKQGVEAVARFGEQIAPGDSFVCCPIQGIQGKIDRIDARRKASMWGRASVPLVVMRISSAGCRARKSSRKSVNPLRANGSPPVSRTFSTPCIVIRSISRSSSS